MPCDKNTLATILSFAEGELLSTQRLRRQAPGYRLLADAGVLSSITRDQYAANRDGDERHGRIQCPCGDGHNASIIKTYVGGEAVWQAVCQDGSLWPLEKDDLLLWQVSRPGLARYLGRCFKCELDAPQEHQSGLWFLGKSRLFLARRQWKIFFAAKLTFAAIDDFAENLDAAILLIGNPRQNIPARLEPQAFHLGNVLDGEKPKTSVLNECLRLVVGQGGEGAKKELTPQELRIVRLIKMLNRFLLLSCDHYHKVETDGAISGKILPYPGRERFFALYRSLYQDDSRRDASFLSKLKKNNPLERLLASLIQLAEDEEFVKNYRAWRAGEVKRLANNATTKGIRRELLEEVEAEEDDDEYSFACDDVYQDAQAANAVKSFGIGTANQTGYVTKSP
jgi:hypothetical protein